MNSKKCKRLRQLVRHLQDKAAVANSNWCVASNVEKKRNVPNFAAFKDGVRDESLPATVETIFHQRILDPKCGRAIYQQMKKRATLSVLRDTYRG